MNTPLLIILVALLVSHLAWPTIEGWWHSVATWHPAPRPRTTTVARSHCRLVLPRPFDWASQDPEFALPAVRRVDSEVDAWLVDGLAGRVP